MYALLAICVSLSTQNVDENLFGPMREKYGSQILRLSSPLDCQAALEELFIIGSPKFTFPCVPRIQTRLFSAMVRPHLTGLTSFITLYTSLSLSKLSKLSVHGSREGVMAARIGTFEQVCHGEDILEGDWETNGVPFLLDEVFFFSTVILFYELMDEFCRIPCKFSSWRKKLLLRNGS